MVDTANQTVTFTATHFSRYALGFTTEEPTLAELFAEFRSAIDETELAANKKKFLIKYNQVLEKVMTKDSRLANKVAKSMLRNLERTIKRYKRNDLTDEEKEALLGILGDITNLK